ncbi:hypothetical protein HDV63DRAFT_248835 [Trichoderma sp. SZMC 28014]
MIQVGRRRKGSKGYAVRPRGISCQACIIRKCLGRSASTAEHWPSTHVENPVLKLDLFWRWLGSQFVSGGPQGMSGVSIGVLSGLVQSLVAALDLGLIRIPTDPCTVRVCGCLYPCFYCCFRFIGHLASSHAAMRLLRPVYCLNISRVVLASSPGLHLSCGLWPVDPKSPVPCSKSLDPCRALQAAANHSRHHEGRRAAAIGLYAWHMSRRVALLK